MVQSAGLDLVFGALADPTRRAILHALRDGEATVGTLAAPFAISQPAVSRHLRVLEAAGLITRQREGTATVCRLRADPLEDAGRWVLGYGEFWDRGDEQIEPLLDTLTTDDGWII